MVDELYHYTNSDGFKGIISGKNIRLYPTQSQDTSEMYLSKEEFIQVVKSALPKLGFLEPVVKSDIEMYEGKSNGDIPREFRKRFYYASFTKQRDSIKHWTCRYGDYGKGVAITIDYDVLRKLSSYDCNVKEDPYVNQLFSRTDMTYSNEQFLENVIRWIVNYKSVRPDAIGYIELMYFVFLIVTKNKKYKWAEEVRIFFDNVETRESIDIYRKTIGSWLTDALIPLNELIKGTKILEEFNDGSRKYHELHMDLVWGSRLIPYVIRGPECTMPHEAIRQILDQAGLGETKIIDSTHAPTS